MSEINEPGATLFETVYAADWKISTEIREVAGQRSLVVTCDKPNERIAWLKFSDEPMTECVKIAEGMLAYTLDGIRNAEKEQAAK